MKCHKCQSPECYRNGKVCSNIKEVLKSLTPTEEKILKVASDIEREFYGKLTRLEEIVEFARRMEFERVGIAFCIGLFEEARRIAEILEFSGFKVYSAACKIGAVDKEELQIEKLKPELPEAVCNPVGQAEALNRVKTDLNIIVGLCVGHDMLFQMHSEAPVTTFIVKDRVLAHNPVGAVYSSYYLRKLKEKE